MAKKGSWSFVQLLVMYLFLFVYRFEDLHVYRLLLTIFEVHGILITSVLSDNLRISPTVKPWWMRWLIHLWVIKLGRFLQIQDIHLCIELKLLVISKFFGQERSISPVCVSFRILHRIGVGYMHQSLNLHIRCQSWSVGIITKLILFNIILRKVRFRPAWIMWVLVGLEKIHIPRFQIQVLFCNSELIFLKIWYVIPIFGSRGLNFHICLSL